MNKKVCSRDLRLPIRLRVCPAASHSFGCRCGLIGYACVAAEDKVIPGAGWEMLPGTQLTEPLSQGA